MDFFGSSKLLSEICPTLPQHFKSNISPIEPFPQGAKQQTNKRDGAILVACQMKQHKLCQFKNSWVLHEQFSCYFVWFCFVTSFFCCCCCSTSGSKPGGGLSMEHEQNAQTSLGLAEVYTCRNNLLLLHNQCVMCVGVSNFDKFISMISVGLHVFWESSICLTFFLFCVYQLMHTKTGNS